MELDPGLSIVLCTVPDEGVAERIAFALLEARAAACVGVLPGLRSVYRWEGRVEDARELQLVVKTRADRVAEVERVIREGHPYQVPEILAIPVTAAHGPYAAWVREESRG
jgi:periplasmic divalent cation tolerance protein